MVFEAEEKGDKAVDDEAEKMIAEAEDRVAKAWVPSDIKLEIVDGEKEGSRWLIVDDTHICYQNNVKGKKGENRRWKVDSIRWECSKRRHMGCPFQIFTSLPENGAPIKALSMKKPQVHTCSAEKLTPLMHKFRLKLASRMQDDLDLSWTKIWNEERQLLLEEVKDQPGLLQQVILEMGDAELFRRTGKFSSESKLFGGGHPCSRATSATLGELTCTTSLICKSTHRCQLFSTTSPRPADLRKLTDGLDEICIILRSVQAREYFWKLLRRDDYSCKFLIVLECAAQ